jgi:hypothetical protein
MVEGLWSKAELGVGAVTHLVAFRGESTVELDELLGLKVSVQATSLMLDGSGGRNAGGDGLAGLSGGCGEVPGGGRVDTDQEVKHVEVAVETGLKGVEIEGRAGALTTRIPVMTAMAGGRGSDELEIGRHGSGEVAVPERDRSACLSVEDGTGEGRAEVDEVVEEKDALVGQ